MVYSFTRANNHKKLHNALIILYYIIGRLVDLHLYRPAAIQYNVCTTEPLHFYIVLSFRFSLAFWNIVYYTTEAHLFHAVRNKILWPLLSLVSDTRFRVGTFIPMKWWIQKRIHTANVIVYNSLLIIILYMSYLLPTCKQICPKRELIGWNELNSL